jgi:hypothetical protein
MHPSTMQQRRRAVQRRRFQACRCGAERVQNLSPSPRQLDLLQYQGGRAALLARRRNAAGRRLRMDSAHRRQRAGVRDSYVVLSGGEECELRVPSGAESGLKLNRGFTLPADGSVALTIDFDLRKSIHAPPGSGVLPQPAPRVT